MAEEYPGEDRFDEVCAEGLGEPALGPIQAELVDALISRLSAGEYPFNKYDFAVASALARELGLASLATAMTAQLIIAGRKSEDDRPKTEGLLVESPDSDTAED